MEVPKFNAYNQQVPPSVNFYSTANTSVRTETATAFTGVANVSRPIAEGSRAATEKSVAKQESGRADTMRPEYFSKAGQESGRADTMRPEHFSKQRKVDAKDVAASPGKQVQFRDERLESVRLITPRPGPSGR